MRWSWRRRSEAEQDPVRDAVVRYLVSGLVTVILISVFGVYLVGQLGHDEALRDAKDLTRATAEGAVGPILTDGVLRGEPAELAKLDRVVRTRVKRRTSVVRVKIRDRSGRIVYSDEPRLIGARYALGPEDLAEFRGSKVDAEVSDLSEPENRFERRFGKLLEVYIPLQTVSGERLRYEEYYRSSFVSVRGRRIFREFSFVMLGALILLALIQLPLAWRLGRRLREGQRERADLLQRAVEASEVERRRIAGERLT